MSNPKSDVEIAALAKQCVKFEELTGVDRLGRPRCKMIVSANYSDADGIDEDIVCSILRVSFQKDPCELNFCSPHSIDYENSKRYYSAAPHNFSSWENWCGALSKTGSKNIEVFSIDESFNSLTRNAGRLLGEVSGMITACPNLTKAKILGIGYFDKFQHLKLQELTFLGDWLVDTCLDGLFQSNLPNLQCLNIGLSYEHAPSEDLEAKCVEGLMRDTFPKLESIAIGYCSNRAEFLKQILSSNIWTHVKTFAFLGVDDCDELFDFLTANPDAIKKIENLYLDQEPLDSAKKAWISSKLPNVKLEYTHQPF